MAQRAPYKIITLQINSSLVKSLSWRCRLFPAIPTALTAQKKGGLYVVDQDTPSEILLYTSKQSLSTWHNRLGHIGIKRLLQLRSQKATTGVDFPDSDVSEFECEICILGKAHRSPIKNKVRERATYPGERLHMDTCGPMQVTTTGGANYIVTIVDDYSRKHFALLVPDKRSIKEKVIAFLNSLRAQLPPQQKIRFIHCDIGGEFINQQLESYAHSIGALITTSAADTPEHNGTAERANQTIVSSARCMLIASGLPPRFWGEAVRIAVFIANASPTKANEGDATPDHAWDGKTTNLSTLRTFGCRVLVKDYHATGKFQVKAREGIYMGPGTRGDGHRIWIPATKAFVCSRDVYFLEEKGKPQLQDSPMIEISEDDDSLSELKGGYGTSHRIMSDEEVYGEQPPPQFMPQIPTLTKVRFKKQSGGKRAGKKPSTKDSSSPTRPSGGDEEEEEERLHGGRGANKPFSRAPTPSLEKSKSGDSAPPATSPAGDPQDTGIGPFGKTSKGNSSESSTSTSPSTASPDGEGEESDSQADASNANDAAAESDGAESAESAESDRKRRKRRKQPHASAKQRKT